MAPTRRRSVLEGLFLCLFPMVLACGAVERPGRQPQPAPDVRDENAPQPAPAPTEPDDEPALVDAGLSVDVAPQGSRLSLEFLLDPRVTGGAYLGEQWVSPATFTQVSDADGLVIFGRAVRVLAAGSTIIVDAAWSISDEGLVEIEEQPDAEVSLTILRSGSAILSVSQGGTEITREVVVTEVSGGLRADITTSAD